MPKGRKHILPPSDLELPHTLHDDRHRIEEVQVPIVTVSATYRSEIAEHLGEESKLLEEVVFSRAHYSMSIAIFASASAMGLTAWYVDPINYASQDDWKKIIRLERFGKIAARVPLLKAMKNFSEPFLRRRPILGSIIEKPLAYVTERTKLPIISLHAEAGNILARLGKQVVQVVTDPYVRPEYLVEADRKNIIFAVFDNDTKENFLAKAQNNRKMLTPERIIVTGPPVDPRMVEARQKKGPKFYHKRGLRLAITTGGMGTNKGEIEDILESLLPVIATKNISLVLYAGTQPDFKEMFYSLASKHKVSLGDIGSNAKVRVLYDPSIIRANQGLIEHVFPWADGIVTKPSGDMAYDAVAAGCFILMLSPWGKWEERIEEIFLSKNISQKASTGGFLNQIEELAKNGWIENAISSALKIDDLFLNGAKKIVDLQQQLSYN